LGFRPEEKRKKKHDVNLLLESVWLPSAL
jgi:hypothetical protein